MTQKPASLFDWNIVGPAIADAFRKLNPRLMVKNPVMFVTMVGAALTTVGIFTAEPGLRGFVTQLAIWLWFTVLFANFAEAVAEGRGKAQAASLRKARKDTMARRLWNGREVESSRAGVAERRPRGVRSGRHHSRQTATWLKESRASMRPRSPANLRPSSARAAATAAR